MTYIYDFKDNHVYRSSFNRLAGLVYGLNFEGWYQNGFWDDNYICHSILHHNEVVANVSVSIMDLTLNGAKKKAVQIGTVMTHPDYRSQGLSRQLMEKVLQDYESNCDVLFLFANHSVLDFYPKFGFSVLPESQFMLKVEGLQASEHSTMRKLDCESPEDWDLIMRMLRSRRPISRQFGVTGNTGLFAFYAMHIFKKNMVYSREDDAVIVYRCEGEVLHLYDVVSHREIDFDGLLSRIADRRIKTVRFHFTPDQLTDQAVSEPLDGKEDVCFFKPFPALAGGTQLCAPKIAHA